MTHQPSLPDLVPTNATVPSLDPPLVLVSLSDRSRTVAAIAAREAFGVNVLTDRQRHLAARFAAAGDRFAGVAYRMLDGVPVLAETVASMVCTVDQIVMVADHVLVLGRPRWCGSADRSDPAIFFGGGYQALSP
jgi:3-hydroxy-9,10-secoandrosta-1,3,5(10)-triene-9,17-dione monooxygenase reductase component